MLLVKTPALFKTVYPGLTWDFRHRGHEVFLTFDDGPTPCITEQVLDLLEIFDAGATFFCIGRNMERSPGLLNRICDAGHTIGNHTYSHLNGMKTRNTDYLKDIELCQTLFHAKLFRPPYGLIRPSQIRALQQKFTIIMWDVMSYDFDAAVTKEQCLSNVLKNIRPGSIIVFHDSLKASEKVLHALPEVLEFLKNKKYNCRSIKPVGA